MLRSQKGRKIYRYSAKLASLAYRQYKSGIILNHLRRDSKNVVNESVRPCPCSIHRSDKQTAKLTSYWQLNHKRKRWRNQETEGIIIGRSNYLCTGKMVNCATADIASVLGSVAVAAW